MLRRAGADDAALLAELGARTFYDTFAADCSPEDMTAYLAASFSAEKQAAEIADPLVAYFIAEIDGTTAGFAQLRAGGAPACISGALRIELARIYVLQEWFGRGVGEALMRASLDEAQRAGHQTIWLGVWEHNTRAIAFYERWGFAFAGTYEFKLGRDRQTDHVMVRPTGQPR
jgi:ribosomal protein S18 acetylase RimI-like enzyme